MRFSFMFGIILASIFSLSLQALPAAYITANNTCNSTNITNCNSGSNITSGLICCTQQMSFGGQDYSTCAGQQTSMAFYYMSAALEHKSILNLTVNCWDHNPTATMYTTATNCMNLAAPSQATNCTTLTTNDVACCMVSTTNYFSS